MQVTIIPSDGFVSVDGKGYSGLSLSVDPSIHAVQFDGAHGWIEFCDTPDGKPQNEPIEAIDPFQLAIDAWTLADTEANKPIDPVEPVEPQPPTAEQNKAIASNLLRETDWTQLSDVNIVNAGDYVVYRALLREIVINPVSGELTWPIKPETVWIAA